MEGDRGGSSEDGRHNASEDGRGGSEDGRGRSEGGIGVGVKMRRGQE